MATGPITKTAVDRLASGWLWDSGRGAVVGFGARRQTDGVFYYLRYRLGGRQRMKSIGRHGSPYTPDTARIEARRLLGLVATGTDPGLRVPQAQPLGLEIERYLALRRASLKPRSFVETQHHLRHHVEPLHGLGLTEIDRRAVAEQLARIETDSGPVARNRVRSSLSRFFRWAIAEGLTEANPATGTAKAPQSPRRRVLSDPELSAIWRACGDNAYGDVVRMLILTGQRREEIGGLRWSELAGAGEIILPPERTKNGCGHTIPLSPQAQRIIARQRRRAGSDFVFGAGANGCSGWSSRKAALDARIAKAAGAPIPGWVLHDVRRSMATRLGDLGVLPHVVEAILNHTSGFRSGVAGVYNLAKYSAEMRAALCAWADHIDAITGGPSKHSARQLNSALPAPPDL